MTATFIDTSFLLALAFPKDALHRRALMWRYALPSPFLTTEFVILEVADGLAREDTRHVAQRIVESLRNSPSTEIIPVQASWIARGYQVYCERRDKNWSLTDCISFEVMREHGISDALTHDHHFEQAGFRALLRHDPPNN